VIQAGKKIATLGPGDLIGEMGLLERRPRNADVIASSPMRLIKLTHWEIRRMSEDTVRRIQATIEERRRDGVADPAHQAD
jgi:CRP-like cAMP-binding protein